MNHLKNSISDTCIKYTAKNGRVNSTTFINNIGYKKWHDMCIAWNSLLLQGFAGVYMGSGSEMLRYELENSGLNNTAYETNRFKGINVPDCSVAIGNAMKDTNHFAIVMPGMILAFNGIKLFCIPLDQASIGVSKVGLQQGSRERQMYDATITYGLAELHIIYSSPLPCWDELVL